MDGEATDLDTVAAGNILDDGGLARDLHELLTSIAILVDVADVTGGQLLLERNADGLLLKTLETDTRGRTHQGS